MKKSTFPPLPTFPPKMGMLVGNETLKQRGNWGKIAKEFQRNMKWAMRKSETDVMLDTSESMIRRRTRVAVDFTERIIDRYSRIPGLGDSHRDEIGAIWLLLNLRPCYTYNMIEADSHILCAVAIWILDQISAQPDWKQKLYPLLPQDLTLLTEVHAPNLWDTDYDKELILSVMYILRSRNIDIAPMEMDDPTIERIWTSDLIAKGGQHKDAPSRRVFEALMNLIPQDAIHSACASFESLLWAWIDRYFNCITPMQRTAQEVLEEANQLASQYNKLHEEFMDILDNAHRKRKNPQQELDRKKPVINPLLADPTSALSDDLKEILSGKVLPLSSLATPNFRMDHFEEDPLHRALRLMDRMNQIAYQREKLGKRFDEINEKIKVFTRYSTVDGYIQPEVCQRDYGDDVAEYMVPLQISNPYEICFGLLWMIENDSDLPWLYSAGCGLMQEVGQSLPWGIIEYDKTVGSSDEEDDWEEDEQIPSTDAPGTLTDADVVLDWYARKYSKDEDGLSGTKRNLAQILYEETGCIIPRNPYECDGLLRSLGDYGISDKDAVVMFHLVSVLSHAHGRATGLNIIEDMMQRWGEDDDAGNDADTEQSLTYEDLSQRLKQIQEENARLRTSLHETEKTSRELRKELASVRDVANLEHRELADLRELIFNQQTDTSPEQPDESTVDKAFPYEVKRNTLIFGGHDTWLKAIRPMLTGNVCFIGTFLNFDAGLVRHSDIIWIQPNALSHSQYNRIIDAARIYSKPVRYFTRASATNGAMEVMRVDQSVLNR